MVTDGSWIFSDEHSITYTDNAIFYTWNFHNVINQCYLSEKKLRHEKHIYHTKNNQKKYDVSIWITDGIDFKAKYTISDTEGNFVCI